MKNIYLYIVINAILIASCGGVKQAETVKIDKPSIRHPRVARKAEKKMTQLEQLLAVLKKGKAELSEVSGVSITSPFNGTCFPPDLAAPSFRWQDGQSNSTVWLLRLDLHDASPPIYSVTKQNEWIPSKELWEEVKRSSVEQPAVFSVISFGGEENYRLHSKATIQFTTSTDRVGSPILFRQVPLPFEKGESYLKRIKWRLGDISSYQEPPVVMQKLSVCAGCHNTSKDGGLLSMEMNYKDDRGAQFIAQVKEEIQLSGKDFMSWNDFPRPEILPKTRGLFARMSPSGRYIVSTVNEISYMALTNDPAFSRLFFPTHGILGWYRPTDKSFHRLPGADDYQLIQSGPTWSPDERYILFSRTETCNEYHKDITHVQILTVDKTIEELNKHFRIKFDIYRLPFNHGNGGTAKPLIGASHNGKSNYFPRYSSDGKWIVFTQSPTGIMLQPDSKLFIVPATGGRAREMTCNRGRFNSWHSWSPNGRWLLFSSKANSIYTEIFLTHVDENGKDTPPVCLARFNENSFAANVPEFVNFGSNAVKKITLEN